MEYAKDVHSVSLCLSQSKFAADFREYITGVPFILHFPMAPGYAILHYNNKQRMERLGDERDKAIRWQSRPLGGRD